MPLVLFLDVDGTISPIAPRPDEAIVPPETKRVVRELARLPGCHVVVVSGRAAADARRVVDVAGVWVIGNHGIERAEPGAEAEARAEIAVYESIIKTAAERARLAARELPGVLVEDKRWTLSVHFRLAADDADATLERAIAVIGTDLGLRLTHGKKIFELRPPVDINKGTAALELARRLGALDADASLLCAGDDRTDEDAFRALRDAKPSSVTVKVGMDAAGGAATAAEFSVTDPAAMRELLEQVVALRRRARAVV
jgi:trehalose-phosphatase